MQQPTTRINTNSVSQVIVTYTAKRSKLKPESIGSPGADTGRTCRTNKDATLPADSSEYPPTIGETKLKGRIDFVDTYGWRWPNYAESRVYLRRRCCWGAFCLYLYFYSCLDIFVTHNKDHRQSAVSAENFRTTAFGIQQVIWQIVSFMANVIPGGSAN